MAKNDVDRVTEEKIRNGGVLVKFYFDVQNRDKEKLQPLLVDLVNNRLMKERGVVYCYGKVREPIQRDDLFITSAIVTALFDSVGPLVNVVFNYAPVAMELLKPEKELRLKTAELQSMLLDLSSVSLTYSRYMLEKIMSKEDQDLLRKQIENRIEIGKRALEESDKEDDGGEVK